MARQHRELHLSLEDAEKLQLYAQSVVSKHHALDDALVKAKARSKHWKWEAKAGAEKITGAEKERMKPKKRCNLPG